MEGKERGDDRAEGNGEREEEEENEEEGEKDERSRRKAGRETWGGAGQQKKGGEEKKKGILTEFPIEFIIKKIWDGEMLAKKTKSAFSPNQYAIKLNMISPPLLE